MREEPILRRLFLPTGRIRRPEFWSIQLIVACSIAFTFFIISRFADATTGEDKLHLSYVLYPGYPLLAWINATACIKRYHDIGKSGWWLLMILIPVIGGFLVYGETGFRRGTDGPNRYGVS